MKISRQERYIAVLKNNIRSEEIDQVLNSYHLEIDDFGTVLLGVIDQPNLLPS
jgi:hypothetical protein